MNFTSASMSLDSSRAVHPLARALTLPLMGFVQARPASDITNRPLLQSPKTHRLDATTRFQQSILVVSHHLDGFSATGFWCVATSTEQGSSRFQSTLPPTDLRPKSRRLGS